MQPAALAPKCRHSALQDQQEMGLLRHQVLEGLAQRPAATAERKSQGICAQLPAPSKRLLWQHAQQHRRNCHEGAHFLAPARQHPRQALPPEQSCPLRPHPGPKRT